MSRVVYSFLSIVCLRKKKEFWFGLLDILVDMKNTKLINLLSIGNLDIIKSSFRTYKSFLKDITSIYDYKQVHHFLQKLSNKRLDAVKIFTLEGTVIVENQTVYALFFNEEDHNRDISLRVEESIIHLKMPTGFPLVVLSKGVIGNELLLNTSIVHEMSHYIDNYNKSEEAESYALELEKKFMVENYKMEKSEVDFYIKEKYS
jgi:hypothetical protein